MHSRPTRHARVSLVLPLLTALTLTACTPADDAAEAPDAPPASAALTDDGVGPSVPVPDRSQAPDSGAPTEQIRPGATAGGAQAPAAAPAPSTTAPVAGRPQGAGAPGMTAAALVPVLGIIDGDTIRVRIAGRSQKIRVIGVDTPESRDPRYQPQCYSKQATSKMQSLAQSRQVRLVADPSQGDADRYGRLLRHVHRADGLNVGLELVRGGFAREYTYKAPYSGVGAYRAAEQSARAAGLGLWGACGGFPTKVPRDSAAPATSQPPSERTRPATTAPVPAAAPGGSCDIKGNINSEGEKIAHQPGGGSYAKTKISRPGERMFCSVAEAQAAGWRMARS